MALLTSPAGTFWDRSAAQSLVGGAWAGASQITLNHSLGSAPDFLFVLVQSLAALSRATLGMDIVSPIVGGIRGNASINTIQVLGPLGTGAPNTAYSQPTIAFEAYSGVIHSLVR